jgi:hypothetical protein
MTHYYLDVRYLNCVITDETGQEFADLDAAVRVAHMMLAKVEPQCHLTGFDRPRVEIFDDNGLVAVVPPPPGNLPIAEVALA